MIILTNKSYWGKNIISYDIIHEGYNEINEIMSDGMVSIGKVKGKGIIVDISLYGDSWPKGVHHYQSDIVEVLKIAEPELFKQYKVLKIQIEKVSDEEFFSN